MRPGKIFRAATTTAATPATQPATATRMAANPQALPLGTALIRSLSFRSGRSSQR
jgi:hypothetical protein